LKILQINASYKPAYIYGGPTMSVSKLSEELVKAGCSVEVFTTAANGPAELHVKLNEPIRVDGVTVRYFKRITKDHSHFSPGLLKAVWSHARDFDVVHIHAWWNLVSVLSCLLALIRKAPVIVSPRGTLSWYSFQNRNALYKRVIHGVLGKRLLKRCGLHATSVREELALNGMLHPPIIFDLPNFVELSDSTTTERNWGGELQLLFLSRIEEKKGLELLLQALSSVDTPWHLTIAGDGNKEYISGLKTLTLQHHISDRITWAGFQKEHKFDLIKSMHLLVLPSYDENFGNVVIECLSAGTPVLISTNVGLAAYVTKNELGWVCDLDSQDISKNINTIAVQRDVLSKISRSSAEIIQRDFNGDVLVKKYIGMYQQYIDRDAAH